MLPYVIRRLLQAIPILLAVAGLIFVMFSVIPGDFASTQMSDGRSVVDAEQVARMNKQFGLDDPVHVRFTNYAVKLATFDLGTSFRTRQPVINSLVERIWPSLQLAIAAMTFAIVLGVPLGFLAALKPGEIYVSDVIGAYVGSRVISTYTPESAKKAGIDFQPEDSAYAGKENPLGKRFKGLIRWAVAYVRDGRIVGYVTMALDHDHLMEFVDHQVPTFERYSDIPDAAASKYHLRL